MGKRHLDREVVTVWRQRAIMTDLIFWFIIAGIVICTIFFDWPAFMHMITGILAALVLLHLVLSVFVVPPIRYRTFFYVIRQKDLLIQEGVFIISQVVIPLSRVQNVETEQGPLLRKHQLTSVSITTAANTHKIPALSETEAIALRDQISELIKENTVNEI
ncbi:PH domain-containing protein [Sporolactobacillus pectinivorans]|uniref:PH domain-containing protein n=1 Tax=Sporolactobacillus pectinivorans TaxID=1591408 RepID=UPI000C2613FE|nr:PH domain-containing protein [Sporolactobacillus pectinivorans]